MLGPPDVNRIDRHLCETTLVIYGPSISSGGRGVERAKFSRNTLHSAGADANLAGNFEDALPGQQLALDSFFQCWADLWPPELFALLYGPLEARMDSLADHAALKLGKSARHLKHELAGRCGRVDRLLI
jgi:hypothetical protein